MILKKGTFAKFSQQVKASEKRIIVYGAGVIGEAVAPYWLHEYQLDEAVLCYVDADSHKQGRSVQLGSRSVPVESLSLLTEQRGNYILLITVSAFGPVVESLEQLPEMEDTEAYFLPIMLLDIAHTPREGGVIQTSNTPLIPKKIHYCWFSGNPIPEPLQMCIDSWKKYCPDYEIIRWDESNYDVEKNLYMKQAYEHQKWGFIPDFARLDILYQHGGIYLDTDVELLRNLNELLCQPAFCSTEKWGTVNTGGSSGAAPGNPIIKKMLDFRKDALFLQEDGTFNLTTCGYYETLPLVANGFKSNGETQIIASGQMVVYASEFFQPFDYMSGETHTTKNTFSIHHFSGTWLGPMAAKEREKTRRKFQEFQKRLIKSSP